ncbi:hypothetical protein BEWA_023630 [Theileria equi strain WA]|uniref:Nuclear pore localisation protein Npl4 ubiquitin-like domain-containing protein n=1 Tax=Theileria equi strain WA TaxID=1537102 RepID=L0AX96_THEEQ|nr:hypothetical protein BEWA_023630 [Theileria equi strain WA]AFZ79514.1 hypothetical protein BEWA_023630 [Theileria equi strain WA]|eukprot:XP_004829180.1 hypothetical protein BEWA_023630 [Theileria equi strain WA]
MSFDGLVVRIRSSIGVSRISLSKDATFGDLKVELNRRFKVNEGTIVKLYTEDGQTEVFGPDSAPLTQLGISHGTSLFLEHASDYNDQEPSISYKSVEKVEVKEDKEEPGKVVLWIFGEYPIGTVSGKRI